MLAPRVCVTPEIAPFLGCVGHVGSAVAQRGAIQHEFDIAGCVVVCVPRYAVCAELLVQTGNIAT